MTKTADGIRVTEIWENQEDFDKFAEDKIGPAMQALGINAETVVSSFDVHNYLTAG